MVLDAADDGALDEVKNHNFGIWVIGVILNFQANILEVLSIPKRLEIAPEGVLVVRIA